MSDWWRETTVYQVYPRSFFDSDNDGIGDIKGLTAKLDYIKNAGFETIWISPFFSGPQKDFGYDISDYRDIAPEFGTFADVTELIAEIHEHNMYVIFDMVLNHTSDQHRWFKESRSSRDNPKRDWYIWKDGKTSPGGRRIPPNNWKSQVSGSGWHWDDKTGQWYWAAFLPFQPDLNYRNPEVKKEIFSMLRFWLDRGVDGFRLDIIGAVFEDKDFRDSPFIWKLFPDEENTGMLFRSTCMTQNLPESIDFCGELRKLTDEYSSPSRFMVGETFGSPDDVAAFCRDGLHSAFAFKCTSVPFSAGAFRKLITEYERVFKDPLIPVWAFSNHDRTRRITALGGSTARAKLNAAFQLTVRGIPFFYYGEEIGMTDTPLAHKESLDPVSFPFKKLPSPVFNLLNRKVNGSLNRDKIRTPMQWNGGCNAGFCSAEADPWLPLNPEYSEINTEKSIADEDSLFNCIARFQRFRQNSAVLKTGRLELLPVKALPKNVLGFRRLLDGYDGLKVIFNFGSSKRNVDVGRGDKLLLSTDCFRKYPADLKKPGLVLEAWECIILSEESL